MKHAERSDWVVTPQMIQHSSIIDGLQNDLLQTVLAVVQDGICILDTSLRIIYANPALCCWYPHIQSNVKQKCYEVYHRLEAPCEVCPTLRAFETREPQTDIVLYDGGNKESGWQRVFSVPVMDAEGKAVLVIEYIRDITKQREAELVSEFVESQNTILLQYLEQKQAESAAQRQAMIENVERSIKPAFNYLDKMLSKETMDIIRRQLTVALQHTEANKSGLFALLTPREMQVAMLIKENYISKEIADRLTISKKAVDFHRTNIRKKLALNTQENLQQFLQLNL